MFIISFKIWKSTQNYINIKPYIQIITAIKVLNYCQYMAMYILPFNIYTNILKT